MERLTDFNKQCIYDCYCLLQDCVAENIMDKNYVASAFNKIEQYKIALPSNLYERIHNFMEEHLSPIIEDPNFFSSLLSTESGYFNDEGVFVINSEEGRNKMFFALLKISIDLKQKINDFAIEHIRVV